MSCTVLVRGMKSYIPFLAALYLQVPVSCDPAEAELARWDEVGHTVSACSQFPANSIIAIEALLVS